MSAALRELASWYVAVALLLPVALLLTRLGLALLAWVGVPLSARQSLRVGRGALLLALVLPLLATGAHALSPAGPLFTFERSVARHAGRLPAPTWNAPAARAVTPARASGPSWPTALSLVGLGLAVGAAVFTGRALARHRRLLRRLEALPRVRGVGRVVVALGEEGTPAFSAWFPRRRGPSAWVVVPPSLLEDAESFRLTVLHELQHHRQRDTHLAFARLVLTGAFFWHPAAHLLSRWLASLQELACDEALVASGRAQAHAYAKCLLQAALSLPGAPPLPAGATGMSHPTQRRIEMLFQPRPLRAHGVAALLAALSLVLLPLATLAQGAARGRTVTLAEAKALAESSQPAGDVPVVVDAQVVAQVNRLIGTEKGRAFMKRALTNLAAQREALLTGLRAKNLPEGLLAVAVVESAVTNMPETSTNPSLAPGLRGAGVWMFIPDTARRYGLEVSAKKDERLDVTRETQAAAALLSDLHARYGGDWRLTFAAYNQGEQLVDRVIAETGSRDVTVLANAGKLNDYTATVQAGLLILRNPHLLD
ncbi:transglycosylase SLT domain-containing protein [Pyxidicoccus fallax]|uniref:Transglycosylase SLT domain-containing protein n=1 Tax=Pyxidicoccus fallax TaxID=394095 RepID=A0A848LDJ8_9BACT|nr:transglycosylase SLT domain-containing protein [Pyxidicoccus fallax]NMO17089.1 transglycosylase SLT domain-containing protein [Pyxidicoccus fallax]NPC84870.1 transglycosylase SLT domain-containing protein [Pyxidicoccus fallax]